MNCKVAKALRPPQAIVLRIRISAKSDFNRFAKGTCCKPVPLPLKGFCVMEHLRALVSKAYESQYQWSLESVLVWSNGVVCYGSQCFYHWSKYGPMHTLYYTSFHDIYWAVPRCTNSSAKDRCTYGDCVDFGNRHIDSTFVWLQMEEERKHVRLLGASLQNRVPMRFTLTKTNIFLGLLVPIVSWELFMFLNSDDY